MFMQLIAGWGAESPYVEAYTASIIASKNETIETGTPLIVSESFNQSLMWAGEGRKDVYAQEPRPGCVRARRSCPTV